MKPLELRAPSMRGHDRRRVIRDPKGMTFVWGAYRGGEILRPVLRTVGEAKAMKGLDPYEPEKSA